MLKFFQTSLKSTWYGGIVIGAAQAMAATPAVQGQSGYISMPSAAVEVDGVLSAGYSYSSPYGTTWVSSTIFPFLQVTGRYVSISGTPQFANIDNDPYWRNYGRYKDKVADVKLQLLEEKGARPALALGATDVLGTGLFKGRYLVATKRFGLHKEIEASVGYGTDRLDGAFAGLRWNSITVPGVALVAEYDANNYAKDFEAVSTGAAKRKAGPAIGIEYRWGWLGAQISRSRSQFNANAYISIPFSEKEFIPKLYEPAYFDRKNAAEPVSISEWRGNDKYGKALIESLARQNFKNIRIETDGNALAIALTNNRISNMGRAVGRAARTALAFVPQGTRSLKITYTKLEQPVVTYEFHDLGRLSDYLTGLINRDTFLQTVLVRYAMPRDKLGESQTDLVAEMAENNPIEVHVGRDGDMIQISSEDKEANRFKTSPKVGFFFNDPSGALRYEVAATSTYDKRLREGMYLNAALRLSLFENISGVTQPSNSLLPHVRTDIADYKRGGRVKLNRFLINQYITLDERWYARISGGMYEEMYRGVGGQLLFLPKDNRWAADLTVDALQQRGFNGWFDKRDYKTATIIGALHYRLPYDVTATVRAGRFLARDEGARLEFKRRFPSGVEIGAWYTKTNGKDITNPGTPAKPYNDKGVFLSVPLNIMLPADTQTTAGFSLSPWTRDVGQQVASPGDLYDLIEHPRRDMSTYDGLGNFAERRDERDHPAVNPPVRALVNPWQTFRWRVEQSVSTVPSFPQWVQGGVVASGAVLAGLALDRPVDRFMKKHQDSEPVKAWNSLSKSGTIALAGTAAGAIMFGDSRMRNIGTISAQSMGSAVAISVLAKQVVRRARPYEESGTWRRTSRKNSTSFPSNHSAVAFAAVTPFAQEYDAPWLYGLAAVTSMGRTAGRKHWTSDVVAGGLLGYAIGTWFWQAQRDANQAGFVVNPGPQELGISWRGSY